MIITLALLASYPLVAIAAIICLAGVVILILRRLHPLRILTISLVNASMIGLIGILSVLPSSLWWTAWILPVLTVGAVAFACWRLLATGPRPEFTRRQTTLLRRPHPVLIALPVLLFVAVAAIPLVWAG